jgi:F-type H+-transporting ATPase subunit b
MPQLDVTFFVTQVFWLAISFLVLFVLMWKVALPRVGDILTQRQERIDDDLQKAEKLRNDAAEVLAAYERTVADGRARAQDILRETGERLAKESAERQAALAETLKRQTDEAEQRIDAARREALANVRTVAAEAAQAAAAKLIGAEVVRADADRAVQQAIAERG